MTEKSIMLDLNDPKAVKIAEIMKSSSCKKILSLLADKELTESDIAKELKMPLNTVGYNIKKLTESGLIESSKNFFWSEKGKRIKVYRISNKRIVISPKSSLRIMGTAFVILLLAGFVKFFQGASFEKIDSTGSYATEKALGEGAVIAVQETSKVVSCEPWAWFLLGAFVALLVILISNWRRIK